MNALKTMPSGRLRPPSNAQGFGYLSFDSRSYDLKVGCGAGGLFGSGRRSMGGFLAWRGRHTRLLPGLTYRSGVLKRGFLYLCVLFVVVVSLGMGV